MGNIYKAIGIMSGTSLDGLDIALVHFTGNGDFKLMAATTLPYSLAWRDDLRQAVHLSAPDLLALNARYGTFLGQCCLGFLADENISPQEIDCIASHGHTVFHAPAKGYTYQIGCGPQIKTVTGITTVTDFRTSDVALGGQGAPLVPQGDADLFGQYQACLNIGGFANLSFKHQNKRLAFDICPTNIVLNELSAKLGKTYDHGGEIAQSGTISAALLKKLNALDFYHAHAPKSLGYEWVQQFIWPIIEASALSPQDALATFTQHAAQQVANNFKSYGLSQVLVSGGGAYNNYLLQLIKKHTAVELVLPAKEIIEFKEALVFAWLGLLRLQNKPNVMASVTGAQKNHSSGIVY
jgi:anhydro-N-acetylmuramic acid kinase